MSGSVLRALSAPHHTDSGVPGSAEAPDLSIPTNGNATTIPVTPKRYRKSVNPVPLSDRTLISIADAARLMSVSDRTAKRLAASHPSLTCTLNRRRLFVRAKLMDWIEAGGCEQHDRRRR